MRVLLIRPPIQDFYRTKFREYPLGLLYLAAALENDGHQVEILDSLASKKVKKIDLPPTLKYLDNYYTKENNLFIDYKHFGISYQEINRRAIEFRPDIIGISVQFTTYQDVAIAMAKALKKALPEIPIIAGGVHATADSSNLINCAPFDYIIKGEGELSFPKLISDIQNGKEVAKIVEGVSPHIDQLQLPARHLIDPSKYLYFKRRYTMLFASRGCPHQCPFCSIKTVMGANYRCRSNDSILTEIDQCIKEHQIEAFDFQDDNLLHDREKFKNLLKEIIKRYGDKRFEWMATNGLNVADIDRQLLQLMERVGFKKLDLALATGPVAARKKLLRPETISQYEEILTLAKEIGLKTTTYIILGLPYQPLEEMRDTINYLRDKDTLIAPSIFYNVPGMPMFEMALKYEYCHEHINRRSSAFNGHGQDFTRDDIFQLFKDVRESNLAKLAGE